MKTDKNIQGDWRIEAVDESNIHIVNDPEYFGYEVVSIPHFPPLSYWMGKNKIRMDGGTARNCLYQAHK